MPDQPSPAADQLAIRDCIARVNNAWQQLRGSALTDALRPCFAEDVVLRAPGFVPVGAGRDFVVQSYHDFIAQAEVTSFSSEILDIDIAGETAVARCPWEITYILEGQQHIELGHDLFVLSRRPGQWVIVWRAMFPEPT
jgi:SnoaL-like domain